MASSGDKVNRECKKISSSKGRKGQNGKNVSVSENKGVIEGCITSTSLSPEVLSVMEDEADKENRHVTPKQGGRRKKFLRDVSNNNKLSLQEELEAAQLRLQKLNIEKQQTEKLLEERDALLKEKEAELQLKVQAQHRLQMQLNKLQKLKEFKPNLSFSMEQSLRMTELAKEDRKKKNNDADFPRRPLPPYILWCSDQWNQVKSENPDAVFKDMASILGLKWKNLNAEGKKPYEEKYQTEKEAYLQAVGQKRRETEALKLLHKEQKQKNALELLEQYLQYKKDAEQEKKSKRKEKDPLKPKQPVTAFFAFSNERRNALLAEKHNVLEIAKILGDEWKSMTKEARLPYEQVAAQAKERYIQEMELYKQRKAEEANSVSNEEAEHRKVEQEQALQLLRKKEREETRRKNMKESRQKCKQMKEKTSDPNRPKKPPTSFIIFSKETRKKLAQGMPGRSNSIMNALVSIKWKELGEVEKKIWHDQAAIAMMQYKKDMEEYNKSKTEEIQQQLEPELPMPPSSVVTC